MRKHTLYFALGMMMTACAPQGYEAVNNIASQTVQDIACKDQNMETKLWDGLKTYLLEQKEIPSAETFKQAMHDNVDKLAEQNPDMTSEQKERLSADLDKLVESLLAEAPQGERVESPEQLLILLSAIDVGDRSTDFRSYMQDKVRGNFKQLSKTVQSFNLNCPSSGGETTAGTETPAQGEEPGSNVTEPTPAPVNRDYEYHKAQALASGTPLSVFGGRWAFATAYQSCQSVQLPSMNDQTPDVNGISIVGKHSDGVGSKRMIASLAKVQSSHYYIRDMSSYGEGCFNVRQNPLIYDYGGKPYATTATTSPIDLFKNNGDGTSVLGIDCSGYVFTSMATAGLRLKAGRALKASDSWAWGSSSYVEPQKNGLTCLDKISVTPAVSMKAGDIVAVYGHVLLIDKVGADPFGIAAAKSEADCKKITSNQFDFVVAQSAPSKGGIGINYYEARNYLPTSSKMKTGLEKYAYYACLAKVNGKSYTPNVGTLSVVRHKGTAECTAPRVKMARESCIQSCSSFVR
ncbi:hypothetical protein QJS83_11490 [Bdellovibrio sp. 22V]|uniref:hypothetical protein n=1 Tax=Bdellovibrio sp. 22V TaxID=3044166 RepID=UPI002543EE97|nr:hypothetical protein [Bdellovibrio sp. 22V]WII71085.1 hypothetical protein QJS83_11490 [Bdellovibrio sp. 22V]